MCNFLSSFDTCPSAIAIAELTLPSRKSTLSRSISFRAFGRRCLFGAGRILDQQLGFAAEDPAFGIDLLDRQLAADLLVFAELGIGPGQRIV